MESPYLPVTVSNSSFHCRPNLYSCMTQGRYCVALSRRRCVRYYTHARGKMDLATVTGRLRDRLPTRAVFRVARIDRSGPKLITVKGSCRVNEVLRGNELRGPCSHRHCRPPSATSATSRSRLSSPVAGRGETGGFAPSRAAAQVCVAAHVGTSLMDCRKGQLPLPSRHSRGGLPLTLSRDSWHGQRIGDALVVEIDDGVMDGWSRATSVKVLLAR
jgi:hypothetical protein